MLDSGYRVEDNSDIENAVINAAKKHYNDGNYDLAIKLYLGLLNTSASSKLYMDVGLCYYKKKDFVSALEYLTRATTLDNKNSVAYSYIGNCHFRKLDANKAIENWTMARSISPKDETVCLNLAIAYFAKNMSYESIFYYDKYLKYSQNRDTQQYKSVERNINGLMTEANDNYIQAQRAELRNDGITAEKNYLAAIKKYPIMSEYNLSLGNLYYKIKQYDKAIEHYEYCLRSHNSKDAVLNLAKSYEAIDDSRSAYCFYKRYLNFTISTQSEYLELIKKINNLRKQIDFYSSNVVLEMAKKHYENNEYYKALVEYENYVILKPESKDDYAETIKRIRSFLLPEQIITRKYLEKGKELLKTGEIDGAKRYFTEVMHLSNPKSNEYKLAKSKILNV